MGIEKKIHDAVSDMPVIKKAVKRGYQLTSVAVFRPKKSEGNITRVTPNDSKEYFFGYYDKSPWDATNRYMLCMRAKDTSKNAAPKDPADIILIDTENNNSIKKIATTHSWNVQQGCMVGWLGPDYSSKIFYNDFRNGKHYGIILNLKSNKETIYDMPFYTVSDDGKTALTLDFTRLHRLRPGYGYSNLEDKTKGEKIPESPCVWKIEIDSKNITPLLTYKQLYNFEHRDDMDNMEHKVNHLMLSPNGERFMVIHRWLKGGKKYSRLLTCDINGKNLYNLSDDNMVSHCYWKNDQEIIAYCRKGNTDGYYLIKDRSKEYERKWDFLTTDGHPSYSPNKKLVVTDTYPNRNRISTIRILSDTVSIPIAKVYSPFKYDNDTRCDLHPRWSRDGKAICFDGCISGNRALYTVGITDNLQNISNSPSKKQNGKVKIAFVMTSCRKSGPTQQTLSIIQNLNRDYFYPILITIYEEEPDTMIGKYLPEVTEHFLIKTGKKAIIRKKTNDFENKLKKINPEIIHSVGVFPNYLISSIGFKNHIFTLRNYAYDDYPAKFGKIKGNMLAKMQIKAIKNTNKVVACSKSLQKIYKERLGIDVGCVQNGVDINKYKQLSQQQKESLRVKLDINKDEKVFIYSGQFIERKNIPFLIEGFEKCNCKNTKLLLLGDGPKLNETKELYNQNNLIYMGSVDNIEQYLNIGDLYISASKSEGLPNGVLEAMSCGLPVLLSDINQHKEIIPDTIKCGGELFKLDSIDDYIDKLDKLSSMNLGALSKSARENINSNFSSKSMSEKYQTIYKDIINNG